MTRYPCIIVYMRIYAYMYVYIRKYIYILQREWRVTRVLSNTYVCTYIFCIENERDMSPVHYLILMCQFVCIHTCTRIYSIAEYRIYVYTCVFCRETHCNTLQHTATHRNTLQHTAKEWDMLPIHYCIHMCKFVCMDTYTYIFYCRISYIHVYTSIYSAYRERETCYPSAYRERERDATRLHIYIYIERERERCYPSTIVYPCVSLYVYIRIHIYSTAEYRVHTSTHIYILHRERERRVTRPDFYPSTIVYLLCTFVLNIIFRIEYVYRTVYVYIHTYLYVHIHIYNTHIYSAPYRHMSSSTYTHVDSASRMYTILYTYIWCICVSQRVCMYVYINTYILVCTCTYIHTHIYIFCNMSTYIVCNIHTCIFCNVHTYIFCNLYLR